AAIPNNPAPDVPIGPDADANVELRKIGEPKKFPFQPNQHFELGEALGLMDFETAAKLSGARFVVLKGPLARLERALAQFMLDLHTNEHGYTEINPPLLVRDDAMFGTAQLPKFEDDQFGALEGLAIRQSIAALAYASSPDQFSKVELVSITTPEQSAEEHERMTKSAEEVLKRLELPFRTVVLSTGDMG